MEVIYMRLYSGIPDQGPLLVPIKTTWTEANLKAVSLISNTQVIGVEMTGEPYAAVAANTSIRLAFVKRLRLNANKARNPASVHNLATVLRM